MSEVLSNEIKNLSGQSGLILGDSKIDVQVGGVKIGEFNANGLQGLENIAIFNETQTSGTNGGTFTSGAWQTRVLNTTVINNITGCSISSNTITLPAGTYYVYASAPAFAVTLHKAKIENTSTTTDLIIGSSEFTSNAVSVSNKSICEGVFTLGSSQNIQLRHRCSVTQATSGFGQPSSFSVSEIYSQIYIKKLA